MTEPEKKPDEPILVTKPAENSINLMGKKYVYKIDDEKEFQKVEIEKNLVLRVLEFNGKKLIDIRRYYKGFPTKKGVRFSYDVFETLKKILD